MIQLVLELFQYIIGGDIMPSEKAREIKLRRRAENLGYTVKKSRTRNPHIDDMGNYMIINSTTGRTIRGARFDMTLDDVEEFVLTEEETGYEKFWGISTDTNCKLEFLKASAILRTMMENQPKGSVPLTELQMWAVERAFYVETMKSCSEEKKKELERMIEKGDKLYPIK